MDFDPNRCPCCGVLIYDEPCTACVDCHEPITDASGRLVAPAQPVLTVRTMMAYPRREGGE